MESLRSYYYAQSAHYSALAVRAQSRADAVERRCGGFKGASSVQAETYRKLAAWYADEALKAIG